MNLRDASIDSRKLSGVVLDRVGALAGLTKPRIIVLLLITTIPAMIVAQDGWPGTWRVVAVLIGGSLSAAGANAINSYADRDIDAVMRRTAGRPVPTARISPASALAFGIGSGAIGFVWLWATVNLLSALVASLALLFYVFVYTLYLKRSTPHNIVIGGAAGAAPVLVGWAAVTGTLEVQAWVMFAIVFYWTPPHFWALSLRYAHDYRRAGVPMLSVVAGPEETVDQIFRYSLLLGGVTLLLHPVADLGPIYLAVAIILGGGLILRAWRLRRLPETSMTFFRFSNTYLAFLFAAIAVDVLVR